jgi:hypothetical protein
MSVAAPGKTIQDGLVLYLDASNTKSYPGSGATWTDISRVGNNGTLIGSPTFSGSNGGILVFNGSSNYVTLTRPSTIITGGRITISLWARWTSTGTTVSNIQALVDSNHSNSPLRGFVIQDRPDLSKVLNFSVLSSATGLATSSFQVGDGNWHHIVGTNDQSVSRLYIDGRLDGFGAEVGGLATVQPNITIGYWQGGGRYLNGSVSQVSIYNRALSAEEVLQNYNVEKKRFGR